MAITTQDGTKLGQTIVSDVTPNANVSVPVAATRQVSPETAILFDKAIIARPLMTPEVCSLRIKNHDYRYRWVNRDALGGRMYTQRKAQGFMNATNNDVDVMGADVQDKDGEIRAGDLILMKIRCDLYDGAIKFNIKKSQTLASARGMYLDGASSDVHSDAAPSRHTVAADVGARTGMAVPFIPDNPDAIIDSSINSGRVEATRKTVDEFRQNAKAGK